MGLVVVLAYAPNMKPRPRWQLGLVNTDHSQRTASVTIRHYEGTRFADAEAMAYRIATVLDAEVQVLGGP